MAMTGCSPPATLLPISSMSRNSMAASCRQAMRLVSRILDKEGSMLDHVGLSVADYRKAKAFYEKALKPLGISVVMEVTPEMAGEDVHAAGFGEGQKPYFWIGTGDKPKGGQHVAFAAASRQAVDEFYRAAIAAGGR